MDNNMTLDDAREKKRAAEVCIMNALQGFHDATGLAVDDIVIEGIGRSTIGMESERCHYLAKLHVRLS